MGSRSEGEPTFRRDPFSGVACSKQHFEWNTILSFLSQDIILQSLLELALAMAGLSGLIEANTQCLVGATANCVVLF